MKEVERGGHNERLLYVNVNRRHYRHDDDDDDRPPLVSRSIATTTTTTTTRKTTLKTLNATILLSIVMMKIIQ
jgi:uncharacterized alpha-E superfamily protein